MKSWENLPFGKSKVDKRRAKRKLRIKSIATLRQFYGKSDFQKTVNRAISRNINQQRR